MELYEGCIQKVKFYDPAKWELGYWRGFLSSLWIRKKSESSSFTEIAKVDISEKGVSVKKSVSNLMLIWQTFMTKNLQVGPYLWLINSKGGLKQTCMKIGISQIDNTRLVGIIIFTNFNIMKVVMPIFLHVRYNICFDSNSNNWGQPSDSSSWIFVCPPSNKMHHLRIHHTLAVNLDFLSVMGLHYYIFILHYFPYSKRELKSLPYTWQDCKFR